MKRGMVSRAGVFAGVLLLVCAALAMTQRSDADELQLPEHPFINDVKCLVLSPYYVPKNIVSAWWGHQKELASFLDSSAEFPSGRKVSTAEKVAYGAVVMPIGAVAAVPLAAAQGGVAPVLGHTADLFAAPFGRPLRFHRLDGSSIVRHDMPANAAEVLR